MTDKKICSKIRTLINEGHTLASELSGHYALPSSLRKEDFYGSRLVEPHLNMEKLHSFDTAANNILLIRFGVDSYFYAAFQRTYETKYYMDFHNSIGKTAYTSLSKVIRMQTGILKAVLDALESGLTDDLFYQRELLVFSDMLNQAYEFCENGLLLAAGTYGRVVLETTIKEFAKEKGVDTDQKFDQIIIKLRKENIINDPLEMSLRANYKIGTWAAHGDSKFNELSKSEIKEFLNFIRDKVLTLR